MENNEKKYKKIKLEYIYDKNYNIISASDVFGGMSPKGKLILHLTDDMHSVPSIEEFKLTDDFKIDLNEKPITIYTEKQKDDNILYYDRIVKNTLILSPDDAINIAIWILDTVVNNENLDFDREKIINHIKNILSIEKKHEKK